MGLGEVQQRHLGAVVSARQFEELGADGVAFLPPEAIGQAELVRPFLARGVPLAQELAIVGMAGGQVVVQAERLGHFGLGLAAGPGGRHRQGQRDAGGREEEVFARLLPIQPAIQVDGEAVAGLDHRAAGRRIGRRLGRHLAAHDKDPTR